MQVMKELYHVLGQWRYLLNIEWRDSGKSVRRRGKTDGAGRRIVLLYTFTLLHLFSCFVCIVNVLCILKMIE